jgi:hypothetical protein
MDYYATLAAVFTTTATAPAVSETPRDPIEDGERKNEGSTTKMAPFKHKLYPLPGGRQYVSRPLAGFENDVEGLRELAKLGVHTLLLGDPGTGKTALFQAAFPESENEIGHSRMTAPEMLWKPRIDPASAHGVTYDPSPLTRAAKNGKPFYFDELMRSNEDALTVLFSAMDGRGFVVGGELDGTDLYVKEGFVVIGASNPLVRGAFLPDAIASRFHIITVEIDEDVLTELHLDERLLVIWKNLRNSDNGDKWSPSIRELLAAQKFIDVGNLPQAAFALTGWRVPARDRSDVKDVVGSILGVRVGILGGVIK